MQPKKRAKSKIKVWLTISLIFLFISSSFLPVVNCFNFKGGYQDTPQISKNLDLENGTSSFVLPAQKNADIQNASISFSNKKLAPANISFSMGDKKIWESPGETTGFGKQECFGESKREVKMNLSEKESKSTGIQLPKSKIEKSSMSIQRKDNSEHYNLSAFMGNHTFWDKSSDEDLFTDTEMIYNGDSKIFSLDIFNHSSKKILAWGDSEGKIHQKKVYPDGSYQGWIDVSDNLIRGVRLFGLANSTSQIQGLSIPYPDKYVKYYYNESGNKYHYEEFNTSTSYRNLERGYLNNDSVQDYSFTSKYTIYYGINNQSRISSPVSSYHSSVPLGDNDIFKSSAGHNGIVQTYGGEKDKISVFRFKDDGLKLSQDISVPTGKVAYSIESINLKGDNFTDFVIYSRNKIIVLGTDDGENFTEVYEINQDDHIYEFKTADLTKNGYQDIVYRTRERDIGMILQKDGSFENIYPIPINKNGFLEIDVSDYDDDGDIDILGGTKGGNIYKISNNLNWRSERITGFSSLLQSYLDSANVTYDQWGNPMVDVPLTIHSEYAANLTLSDLNITYNYTANLDITNPVKNYVATHQANETGWVNVPLNFIADTPGEIWFDHEIEYGKRAPLLETRIPSTFTVERGDYAEHLIDLSNYFQDPNDLDISYSVSYQEDPDNLSAFLQDDHYLTFESTGDLGTYSFRVKATNTDGYTQESNTFDVQVTPPPPDLDLPDEYKVRAEMRDWFDISEYASGYESRDQVNLTTTSDNIETHPNNMTLELEYPNQMTETVQVTLTADGTETSDTFEVTATPYAVPLFEPLPDPFLEKGENLTRDNSFNLHNHTTHPEEDVEDLDYTIVDWEDDVHISIGIEEGWILGWIHPDYHGTSTVTVSVEDSNQNTDQTTFDLIVNDTKYPPEYLGGLEDDTVEEGEEWMIDLEDHFEHLEEDLLYQSNKDEITIYNGSWAVWEPEDNASDLTDVVFTARLTAYPELKAESDPINLFFEEQPPMPHYNGTIYSSVVHPGETWSIDLTDHFTHDEDPDRLGFNVTHDQITIENNTASWTPEEDSKSLTNVTFTAYDVENPDLTATSQPIDLAIPSEGAPDPVIVSITPENPKEGDVIHFKGQANNSLGNTSYRWTSDVDGELSDRPEFNSTLSPGEHLIKLEVKDMRGNWSRAETQLVTVEEEEEEEEEVNWFRSFLYSMEFQVALIIILVGLTLNFLGNRVLTEKPEKEKGE